MRMNGKKIKTTGIVSEIDRSVNIAYQSDPKNARISSVLLIARIGSNN